MADSRIKKVGILASGETVSTLLFLVTFAVLSRVLSKEEYGTYRQTLLAYFFAAPLLTLGLPQALYYFLPGERRRARAVVIENLLLLTIMGAVFTLFFLLGGNHLLAWCFGNPGLVETLVVLAPFPIFMLPAGSVTACLMVRGLARWVMAYNVGSRFLMLGLVTVAALYWRTSNAAVAATVVGASIGFVAACGLMLKSVQGNSWAPSLTGMRAQFRYGVPLGVGGMIAAINVNIDKVIVSSLCDTETFAVYSNGAMEVPFFHVLAASVTAVLLPEMASMAKENRIQDSLELWKQAAVSCALIIMPCTAFLMVTAPELMRLIFSPEYEDSAAPFRIYLLMLPARVAFFSGFFMATGRNHLIVVRAVVSLTANVVLSIVFVNLLGYLGAAVATVIVLYVWAVPFCVYFIGRIVKKGLSELIPYWDLVKILVASSFCTLPLWFADRIVTIPDPVFVAAAALIYFPLSIVALRFMGYGDAFRGMLTVFKSTGVRR